MSHAFSENLPYFAHHTHLAPTELHRHTCPTCLRSFILISFQMMTSQLRGCLRSSSYMRPGQFIGPVRHWTGTISSLSLPPPSLLLLTVQPCGLFTLLWLMRLVSYRPLPLTPIKTQDTSSRLSALKLTAGPPSPSSPLSLTHSRDWVSLPIRRLLTQQEFCLSSLGWKDSQGNMKWTC